MNKKYTKEQLIEYIQEFAINNNRLPICRKNELPVNDATIKKYFGSWNNGMIAAGFVPRYAERGKKPKTLTFTLTTPDSTTLDDSPAHQIVKGYLKRWKIAP